MTRCLECGFLPAGPCIQCPLCKRSMDGCGVESRHAQVIQAEPCYASPQEHSVKLREAEGFGVPHPPHKTPTGEVAHNAYAGVAPGQPSTQQPDAQAGQDTCSTAASNEAHAAGPACSGPINAAGQELPADRLAITESDVPPLKSEMELTPMTGADRDGVCGSPLHSGPISAQQPVPAAPSPAECCTELGV